MASNPQFERLHPRDRGRFTTKSSGEQSGSLTLPVDDEWSESGFDENEAMHWRHEGFGPRLAAAFRDAGESPTYAGDWMRAGFPVPPEGCVDVDPYEGLPFAWGSEATGEDAPADPGARFDDALDPSNAS